MADLHNLVPALGEINGDRSNYPFVDNIAGEIRRYGSCDIEIDNKKVEPPDYAKGFIARAYLYMDAVYNIGLSQAELSLMNQWHTTNPPDAWEIERNNIIFKYQGNRNQFIFLSWLVKVNVQTSSQLVGAGVSPIGVPIRVVLLGVRVGGVSRRPFLLLKLINWAVSLK